MLCAVRNKGERWAALARLYQIFEHYEQTGGDINKQEQQCETDKESASVERLGQAGV